MPSPSCETRTPVRPRECPFVPSSCVASTSVDVRPERRHRDPGPLEERALAVRRLHSASASMSIARQSTVGDDLTAGDEHVANAATVGAPDELQADVTPRRPSGGVGAVDDDVGLFADLESNRSGHRARSLWRLRWSQGRTLGGPRTWSGPAACRGRARRRVPRCARCRLTSPALVASHPSATRPPRSTISAWRPCAHTPCPSRR